MNIVVLAIFLAMAALWLIARVATWPWPEWSRRAFWIAVMALICLPTFLGHHMDESLRLLLLSSMGGLAVSEFLLVGAYRRWLAFQVKLKEQADMARRRARRMARREAREKKDQIDN